MLTRNLTGIICLVLLCFVFSHVEAQNSNISVGTETIKPGAILWLKAQGNQGLLLPVITNRSAFSGLNNSDDKGMVVYDASDNKIYYWNGTAWISMSGGADGINQVLSLTGNTISLSGSPSSTITLSTGTPVTGQALVWNGAAWAAVSLGGDVTGAQGTNTVSGLKGKALPSSLPTTANALVYDGTSWTFQPLSAGGGEANTASNVGTAGVGIFKQKTGTNLEFSKINAASSRISVTADGTNSEIDIDVVQANLTLASTQITGLGSLATLSAVTSALITDKTVTGTDIADLTITGTNIANATIDASKLSQSAATTGQVLKWNGTAWTAQNDDAGAGAVPTLSNGEILIGNGTANSKAVLSGDAALSGGAITINAGAVTTAKLGASSVDATKLADNAVTSAKVQADAITSAKILNGTITGADIASTTITADKMAQSGATTNQVLQWNGTNWIPATVAGGSGTVTSIATGTGLTGGPITLTGTISIAAGGVTATELATNAVTTAKIQDGAITTAKLGAAQVLGSNIGAATITDANIANTTITAGKLAASGATANQVLQWNGTNWAPATAGAGTVTNITTGTGLTGGPITNTGTIGIAAGGVTTTELATNSVSTVKIQDGAITTAKLGAAQVQGSNIAPTTITADKLAQSGATANQVLQWNGTNWVPASAGAGTVTNITTGTGLTGGPITNTGTIGIAAGGVTATELATNAVTTAKIQDGAITTAKIGAAQVLGSNIGATTITDANIANTTITAGKLAASGATVNQVLQYNGTAWAPATIAATLDATAQTGVLLGNGTTITGSTAGAGVRGILGSSDNTVAWVTGSPNQFLGTNASGDLQFADKSTLLNGLWGLSGNAGIAPATDFVGTTDAQPLIFRTNNVERMRMLSSGFVGIGTNNPRGLLELMNGNLILAGSAGAPDDPVDIDFKTYTNTFKGKIWMDPNSNTMWMSTSTSPTANKYFTLDQNGNFGFSNTSPSAKVDIIGTFKLADGTQGAGKILTSDATGLASWQAPSSGWSLTGNAGTVDGTNFIGTTDNVPLTFRVANVKAGKIALTGAETFIGYQAGSVNTGTWNTGMGYLALGANSSGSLNTAFGATALQKNTTANRNTAVGYGSLFENLTGTDNVALGYNALKDNLGNGNVAIGSLAGVTQTVGFSNTTGSNNVFIGNNAGPGTSTPISNATAIGYEANVAVSNALVLGGTGADAVNVGIGTTSPDYRLQVTSSGINRLSLTSEAGTNDILFGTDATPVQGLLRYNHTTHEFQLGYSNGTIRTYSNQTGFGIFQSATTYSLEVAGNALKTVGGTTWVVPSDRRIKTDIRDIDNSLELVKRLRPVKYKYTEEWKRRYPELKDEYYYSFIAQELKEVFPESVNESNDYLEGDPTAILHIDVNNAQITTIKAVQELILKVEQLEKENAALKAEKGEMSGELSELKERQKSMAADLEAIRELLGMKASTK